MDFLNTGIPVGRYWGINVRLHFTFLIFAYYRAMQMGSLVTGLVFVVGLYVCVLLHEFGHALAARWCDGEAEDILLWPLGGLAYCRPAWNPTAHLITTVAGPFVTLLLWLGLGALAWGLGQIPSVPLSLLVFLDTMSAWNFGMLLFNLIPAFPMDGGRIVRDTLWHWMSAEKATKIAVRLSWVLAGAGAVWAILYGDWWLLVFPVFIAMQTVNEQRIIGFEAGGTYEFSVRERIRRGRRQRGFRQAVAERHQEGAAVAFHRCASCGRNDQESPDLEFRVCPDCANGEEYCREHLDAHEHR